MPPLISPHPLQPVAIEADTSRDWLSEQGRAHSKAAGMADVIRNAAQSGKRMQPVWRNYLRNPQVRLSAALQVLGENPSRDQAISLRDSLHPMSGGYDPIFWYAQRKESGGERYICKLPPDLKAIHYMLKRPLEKLFEREGNVFGVKDFSRDDLAEEIKALQNQGFTSIATTDVIGCYQAVDPDAPYQLPLPREVIQYAIDCRSHTLVRDRGTEFQNRSCNATPLYDTTHMASRPRGLMQGSPISGIILAWLLKSIPTREDVRVFLCFDNLIVMARSPSETRAMVDTLAAHFEQCSAGPLALCEPEYADNVPIEFLGYLFDPTRDNIGIGEKGQSKLIKRLIKVEGEQEAIYNALLAEHQTHGPNSLFASQNPYLNHFPIKVWETLRSFRAGFPSVQSDAQEFEVFCGNSRWLAERTGDGMALYLHDNLFAAKGTDAGDLINGVMRSRC